MSNASTSALFFLNGGFGATARGDGANWPMIANQGSGFNLLIPRKVTNTRLAELKTLFGAFWPGTKVDPVQQQGRPFVYRFVDLTYPTDKAVAQDHALQCWMKESADPSQGNIRGLPEMTTRDALKRVLTSLVYRVAVHGISRLESSTNPAITFVANFPSCLQRLDIPLPGTPLTTKQLLTYLPNI